MAQSFGVRDEWAGSPPAKVFQFLCKFAKAGDKSTSPKAKPSTSVKNLRKNISSH